MISPNTASMNVAYFERLYLMQFQFSAYKCHPWYLSNPNKINFGNPAPFFPSLPFYFDVWAILTNFKLGKL